MTQVLNKKICMCLLNNFTNDSRVLKEAISFIEAGYEVTVIAKKDDKTLARENISGIDVVRLTIDPYKLKTFLSGERNNLPHNAPLRLRARKVCVWRAISNSAKRAMGINKKAIQSPRSVFASARRLSRKPLPSGRRLSRKPLLV